MTDYAPLSLHVPEPAVRPGRTPDFSSVRVPGAGSVARPKVDADPSLFATWPIRSSGSSTETVKRAKARLRSVNFGGSLSPTETTW